MNPLKAITIMESTYIGEDRETFFYEINANGIDSCSTVDIGQIACQLITQASKKKADDNALNKLLVRKEALAQLITLGRAFREATSETELRQSRVSIMCWARRLLHAQHFIDASVGHKTRRFGAVTLVVRRIVRQTTLRSRLSNSRMVGMLLLT